MTISEIGAVVGVVVVLVGVAGQFYITSYINQDNKKGIQDFREFEKGAIQFRATYTQIVDDLRRDVEDLKRRVDEHHKDEQDYHR